MSLSLLGSGGGAAAGAHDEVEVVAVLALPDDVVALLTGDLHHRRDHDGLLLVRQPEGGKREGVGWGVTAARAFLLRLGKAFVWADGGSPTAMAAGAAPLP